MKELVEQAKSLLALDLNVELVFNQKSLLSTPFSPSNINLFGTKLLDILFTKEDLSKGTIEPVKTTVLSLNKKKIDLIKGKTLFFKIFYLKI